MGTVVTALRASDGLLVLAGREATPRAAVAALALALGRVCGAAGVNLDTALVLVKLAAREADPARWGTAAQLDLFDLEDL
jgi:hypothetical protein